MEQAALPLVSVVIPVYNGANYLREAIESALSQAYPNLEVVVVDDGSTDETWAIIQSYGARVVGLRKENGGVASALNAGIRRAQGPLVAWLSHDDIFLPGKLARQAEFMLAHPEAALCYTDFEIIDATGARLATVRTPWEPARALPGAFLRDMYINGSTTMLRKTCFEQCGGFDERLAHTQDLEMWLRLAEQGELGHLPEVLIQSRSHAGQGSLNFEHQIEEEHALFAALFERLGPERFFPALAGIADARERLARGREWFADALRRRRGWRRFALEQYRMALALRPSLRLQGKILWTRAGMALMGDERESLTLARRARILLSLGQIHEARRLSEQMVRHHPLRLDALAIWLGSWLPRGWMARLKQVRRRLRP